MKRIALLSLAIAAFACKPAETSAEASSTTEPAAKTEESAKPEEAAKSDTVLLKTSMGEITIELDREKAPITVENFLNYVKKGHYDGTVFHRVMDGFMIQGGGFVKESSGLVEKTTGKGIKNEGQNGLKNVRGSIAMARTADPNSATAQFFINVVDNPALDFPNNGGYAVFGKVTKGMDVVDKIKAVATGSAPPTMLHPVTGEKMTMPAENVPNNAVTIESAKVVD